MTGEMERTYRGTRRGVLSRLLAVGAGQFSNPTALDERTANELSAWALPIHRSLAALTDHLGQMPLPKSRDEADMQAWAAHTLRWARETSPLALTVATTVGAPEPARALGQNAAAAQSLRTSNRLFLAVCTDFVETMRRCAEAAGDGDWNAFEMYFDQTEDFPILLYESMRLRHQNAADLMSADDFVKHLLQASASSYAIMRDLEMVERDEALGEAFDAAAIGARFAGARQRMHAAIEQGAVHLESALANLKEGRLAPEEARLAAALWPTYRASFEAERAFCTSLAQLEAAAATAEDRMQFLRQAEPVRQRFSETEAQRASDRAMRARLLSQQ